MTASQPFISLRNVRKVYRTGGQEFLAVSDVTMDVQEGELVSLVGPSGCGKTTVLEDSGGAARRRRRQRADRQRDDAVRSRAATSAWCSSRRCC